MKQICVYCGSNPGRQPAYREAALALAEELVANDLGLVYGGAHVGIMGILADGVLKRGGRVTGIIPQSLVAKELAHPGLTELHVVASMHERKAMMAELSQGFIALPGGLGTLEEILEVLTWAQLGFHDKPCGLLNVAGYYDGLVTFLDHAVGEGFVRLDHRSMMIIATEPREMLAQFKDYQPPEVAKWIGRNET